jgi:tyrosine-specific transport protein
MNKLIGTTLLVAGTTIGAGMLALPLSIAFLGPVWGLVALVSFWIFMVYASFATLEASLQVKQALPISVLARKTLGVWAERFLMGVFLLLFWTLLAAYFTGTSSLMGSLFSQLDWGILEAERIAGVGIIMGMLLLLKTQWIDAINRIWVLAMGLAFITMIFILLPFCNGLALGPCSTATPENFGTWALALPIFFAAFGFHGSIHSLAQYANLDVKLLKKAFFLGSGIAFVVYALWITVSLSALANNGIGLEAIIAMGSDIGVFISHLQGVTQSPILAYSTWAFSFLAILTSALGVGLGLKDMFVQKLMPMIGSDFNRNFTAMILTIALPIGVAIVYPNAFIASIRFAAVCLSLIAAIFPALILWRFRKQSERRFVSFKGGAFGLMLLLIGGLSIIFLEGWTLVR